MAMASSELKIKCVCDENEFHFVNYKEEMGVNMTKTKKKRDEIKIGEQRQG